jgi:hypothetical protein
MHNIKNPFDKNSKNEVASRRWLIFFLKYDSDIATREMQVKHLWIATKLKKQVLNDYFEKNEGKFWRYTTL